MIEYTLDYGSVSADGQKLKLVCHGIGTFDVVTGMYAFENDPHCSDRTNAPIPVGTYYIVEREAGSLRNRFNNWSLETYRNLVKGITNDKSNWFSLISARTLDNSITVNGHERGGLKLHPLNSDGSGYSDGCVTLYSYNEYLNLRREILKQSTSMLNLRNGSTVKCYGTIRVIGNPDSFNCPVNIDSTGNITSRNISKAKGNYR